MSHARSSFFCGTASGAATALAVALLLGNSHPGAAEPSAPNVAANDMVQQYDPADYFVTGEGNTATLWRRERDGTLTCISVNTCRLPTGR